MKKLILKEIINYFEENNIQYQNNSDINGIIADYFENINKQILPKEREVYVSTRLKNKLEKKYSAYEEVINVFKKKFTNGENINGHLSRKIFDSTFYDKLLSSWGIYHVHLNEKDASSNEEMRKNRSDLLLFIKVTPERVYFIDIQPHNKKYVFSSFELLEIIADEWPFLIEPYEIKDAVPGSLKPKITSDKDIHELREASINTILEIKGKVYMPGFGITSMRGSSQQAMLKTIYVLKKIEKLNITINNVESLHLTPYQDTFLVIKLKDNKELIYI